MPRSRSRAEGPGASAEESALRLLGRREHSRQELEHKLSRRGYPEAEVAAALERLSAEGWLDEARYCESLCRQRLQQGYGPRRLRWELAQRGIGAEAIGRALAAVSAAQWLAAAGEAARRLGPLGQGAADARELARRRSYLYRRGFEPDQVRRTLGGDADGFEFE